MSSDANHGGCTSHTQERKNEMKNYDGQEMQIRLTSQGRYQVLPMHCSAADMSRAPVFATECEALAYIVRPMPRWVADERSRAAERDQYIDAYSSILVRPEMREKRHDIQELYSEACWRSKNAADLARAAARSMGQMSVMGRDVGATRLCYADEAADRASDDWAAYGEAYANYERALQAAMVDAGIPVALFRSPILEVSNV